jgi:hypothetical protein
MQCLDVANVKTIVRAVLVLMPLLLANMTNEIVEGRLV